MFPLTDNTDYYGSFKCQETDPMYEFSLMSTRDYYETYSLTEDGHLVASHPSYEEDGGRVEHTYNKHQFCLIYLQVFQYKL
jgi:hypothetical protein